jgi:biopolymer transport protein ExbD
VESSGPLPGTFLPRAVSNQPGIEAMGMTAGGGGKQKAEINMTPMIDVLLVLIIIFMVITPITSRGLRTQVPQPDSRERQAAAHEIVVTVRADRTVLLNQEPLDLAGLQQRLLALFKHGANAPIFVRGAGDIEFARVAEVIDLARGAGVIRVALMTN